MSKLVLVFSLLMLFSSVKPSLAAKQRVWSTQSATAVTTASKPTYSVKLRSDRKALNVIFNNVTTASSVTYELTYLSGELDKGVFGSILPKEGNYATRLLLFGTCSKNVCTYHQKITNMEFKITAKLKSGKTSIKKYKIKV